MCTSLPPDKLAKFRTMVKELVRVRVVRDRQQLESLVGHLVYAATGPLGESILEGTLCDQGSHQTRADRTSQPGSPFGAGLVGATARTLAQLIGAPIPAFKAARSAYIHGRRGILGLWCMVSVTLVPGTVEQGVGLADNRPQRIAPGSNMGQHLQRAGHSVPLRQCSCGRAG